MKHKSVISITQPLPGWTRLRKIEDHSQVVDIDPKNEMHVSIKKNLLRSGFWEEIPTEAQA